MPIINDTPLAITGTISVTPVADQLVHGLVNITASIPLQVTASVPNLTASISNLPLTQSVSWVGGLVVTSSVSSEPKASTTSFSQVLAANSNVNLSSPNTARLGVSVYNSGTGNLYLKLGQTASLTSYTVIVGPSAYYEAPYRYTGQVDGYWDVAGGSGSITEFSG